MSIQLSDFDATITCEDFYLGSEPESIENTCPNCGTDHSTLADVIACGEDDMISYGEEPFDALAVPDTEYPW